MDCFYLRMYIRTSFSTNFVLYHVASYGTYVPRAVQFTVNTLLLTYTCTFNGVLHYWVILLTISLETPLWLSYTKLLNEKSCVRDYKTNHTWELYKPRHNYTVYYTHTCRDKKRACSTHWHWLLTLGLMHIHVLVQETHYTLTLATHPRFNAHTRTDTRNVHALHTGIGYSPSV